MSQKLLPENFHEKQTDEKPEEFVEKSIREKISHEIGTNAGKIGISLSSVINKIEFQNLDLKKFSKTMKNPVLVDCTGLVKPLHAKENGFIFRGIGRGDI